MSTDKLIEATKIRLDSWYNALTGLGNGLRDKLQSTTFVAASRLTDEQLETLYHEEDMAARICEALPEEALRKGYHLNAGDDTEIIDKVQEYEKRLKFRAVLRDAAVWARTFGGAAIILGVDDGQKPDRPVNEEAIKGILYATVLDRRDLMPERRYSDPLKPKYGDPETYRIQSTPVTPQGGNGRSGEVIHESRLLLLSGARTSLRRRIRNNGWSESVLQKVHEVLVQFNIGWQGTAHLLQDAAQGVFKIDGLIDMIASGDKETLHNRMELVDMSRSVARAIMLDAERESYERVAYTFAGIPDVLKAFMLRLSAAARMPVTVLMGQSPAGLNATGESDTRMWYDQVQAYQEEELKPQIERFYELMLAAADFDGEAPDEWDVRFERLWQLTDKEQAEVEKLTADKDKLYIDAGVLLAEEVAVCRFKARGFSAETQIDLEARQEMLEAELELAKDKAGEDPLEEQMKLAQAAPAKGQQALPGMKPKSPAKAE